MHAAAFMLGIAYAGQADEHVRVDVLYAKFGRRGQVWVNLLGHLVLLLPLALTFAWYGVPYAVASWRILEGSPEVGGIPGLFLLKSLIPLMAITLLLQAVADISRWLRALSRAEEAAP